MGDSEIGNDYQGKKMKGGAKGAEAPDLYERRWQ